MSTVHQTKQLTLEQIDKIAAATDIHYVASGEGDYGGNGRAIVPFARAVIAEFCRQNNIPEPT